MTETKKIIRRPKPIETPTPTPEPPKTVASTHDYVQRVDLGFIDGPQRRNCVVGIDQSLNKFAIAAFCPDDGTAALWLFKNPDSGRKYHLSGPTRLLALESYVETVMMNLKLRCPEVLHICMEGYNRGARNWREEAGELSWMTRRMLLRIFGVANIIAYPTFASPGQVKQFATQNGSADKNLVLKAVFKKWGVDVDDDNLADAYTLSRMAAAIVTGQTAHTYEAQIISKLERHTEWEHTEPPQTTLPSRSSGRAKRAS